eukprot:191000_1
MSASHQTGDTVRVWDPGEDDSGPEENRWRRSGNGEGLTSEKYALKLEQWGPNQLTPAKKESACLKLLKCVFGGFFNILMWVGSVLSFIAYAVEPDPAEQNQYLSLGVVLAFVVSLTGGVMYWQESTSENLMDSFKNFLPPSVNVHRSGVLTQIDAVQLVPGDLIELKAGDKLPADVRFVKAAADVLLRDRDIVGSCGQLCPDKRIRPSETLRGHDQRRPEGDRQPGLLRHAAGVRQGDRRGHLYWRQHHDGPHRAADDQDGQCGNADR